MLHLLAMAHEADVDLHAGRLQRIGDRVPTSPTSSPGQYLMNDVDRTAAPRYEGAAGGRTAARRLPSNT